MRTDARTLPFRYAPTDKADIIYPESDGKLIAETDLHTDEIIRMRQMLKAHFAKNFDVYISGNILIYYIKGNMRRSVSPDLLVSFGIGKRQRRTYRIWEEGKPPDFVVEFSSKKTFKNDLEYKMGLYARIGISEYFLYDAERCYLPSPLMAFRLIDGEYVEIQQGPDGGFFSETLGLAFHLLDDSVDIYDPDTEKWLLPAEERIEQEADARQKAEAEVARLQEELKRLQNTSTPSA